MTTRQLIKKVLRYDWELWADRPFQAFMLSAFKSGHTRKDLRLIGVDAELPAQLYQNGGFLKSPMVWDAFAAELDNWIKKGGGAFKIVRQCEQFYKKYKPQVIQLSKTRFNVLVALGEFEKILRILSGYIWLAHGLEHIYAKKLRAEVPKYYIGDIEKYIGDISYPVKKNAHAYMEKALRSSESLVEIQKKYAWIKVRDGFSPGFTVAELAAQRKRLRGKKIKPHLRPSVHPRLRPLVNIAQELVYYRTYRTDVWHEFMYLARPLFKRVARELGIAFRNLKYYDVDSLIQRQPKSYGPNPTFLSYRSYTTFLKQPIHKTLIKKTDELKGAPAFWGKVIGRVKVVMSAAYINKVKTGDILVAPTTSPSYITGMAKAAAFVTDEGGITSHAAIVSREMKKPCIIGTKMATKVFKDGDRVEVDATKGIVRKI